MKILATFATFLWTVALWAAPVCVDGVCYPSEEMAREALNSAAEGAPEEILNAVQGAVKAFAGDAPQFDDMTMMCLHFKGSKQ